MEVSVGSEKDRQDSLKHRGPERGLLRGVPGGCWALPPVQVSGASWTSLGRVVATAIPSPPRSGVLRRRDEGKKERKVCTVPGQVCAAPPPRPRRGHLDAATMKATPGWLAQPAGGRAPPGARVGEWVESSQS